MIEASYLATTRTAYDTVAVNYAEQQNAALDDRPLDRAMLVGFAQLVLGPDGDPDARAVADLGCGPGHVTAHLRSLGLTARGIDLSPAMVAVARAAHPDLRFDEGSMTALDLPDGVLGGILARYSIIHTPPEQLPVVFAEFHRVLALGGHVLLAFQVGDERVHVQKGYGHDVSLDAYRLSPDTVVELLERAGFEMVARLLCEREENEKTPQAHLIARKPGASGRTTVMS